MTTRTTILALLGLGLGACKNNDLCTLDADITGGCGLVMADGELRLGDTLEAMVDAHGEPSWVDLGSAGRRFDYGDQGSAGISGDGLAVSSLLVTDPWQGSTIDGLILGVEELEVPRTISAGVGSPFVPVLWFPELGIGFESAEATVIRMHIFTPQETW